MFPPALHYEKKEGFVVEHLGVSFSVKNIPELDPGFLPLQRFNEAHQVGAAKPVGIAVERANGEMAVVETFLHGTEAMRQADHYYLDRLVKTMLWMKGGYKIYVRGDEDSYTFLKGIYCAGGKQDSQDGNK